MYKFALLLAAAMTATGAGSLVTKTKLAPPIVDRADDAIDPRSAGTVGSWLPVGLDTPFDKGGTLMATLLFSLAGLTLSLIIIATCSSDLSALAVID
jgi:hypothetical protein